ncbi:hypothetical protein EJB05_11199, partial [Eragrostis curvula]
MELRPRRRLGSRPQRRRRNPGAADDSDGVDRISGLPDDLLLLVLARLRSARDAARTSVLSTRWSDLWRRLPELYFRNTSPGALDAALAKVAVPKLSVLDIAETRCNNRNSFSAAEVASLLRNAARLNPMELRVEVPLKVKDRGGAVELPCFAGATSINLELLGGDLSLTLPAQGGDFPVLEILSIGSCLINSTSALISRCPNLRMLKLNQCLNDGSLTVHSTTIEELTVNNQVTGIRSVDIEAPVLKKFIFSAQMHEDYTISITAPMVTNQSWSYGWHGFDVRIDQTWCLFHLKSETDESGYMFLSLDILRLAHFASHERKLHEIYKLPECDALELYLEESDHFYGGMVLNILRMCNGIQRLKLVSNYWFCDAEACPLNCPCDQPQNWTSHDTLLSDLEEVEIVNFEGSAHEVDFLKLLFRCATLTKVIVRLDSKVSTRSKGCKEIYNFFKANPSVECNIYQRRGKEVVYA